MLVKSPEDDKERFHVVNMLYAARPDIRGTQNLGADVQYRCKLDGLG